MGRPEKHYIEGYPSLAAFIASDPDRTTLIFKRFDRLAARNLLHLQSELAKLEAEQDALDKRASAEDMQSKQCLRNWEDFSQAAGTDLRQKERLDLAQRIRKVLKEYRALHTIHKDYLELLLTRIGEALILESTLACFPEPSSKILKAFRRRFFNGDKGDEASFPVLGGNSSKLFDDEHDLVALKAEEQQDRLTTFAQDHLAFLFQQGLSDGKVAYSSDKSIAHFVTWMSVLIAAVLLIGAIVSLYFTHSPGWRLALTALFTMAFAAGVGLLTNARRAELFAATAAYAAVLVVFVSGNLGNAKSS